VKKLKSAVNIAIKRYPYFAVRVGLDEDGGYVLESNPEEVVILGRTRHLPKLGSRAVNGHLLFVQCEGREINFYISHALCGGRGAQPWVMSTVGELDLKQGVLFFLAKVREPILKFFALF
jgi:hypothetical protein